MTNKFVAFAIVFVGGGISVQAQVAFNPNGKIFDKVALFGGPSIASLRGSEYLTSGVQGKKYPKIGYNFGIAFTKSKGEKSAIEITFLLERKGAKAREIASYWDNDAQEIRDGTYRRDYEFNTISIRGLYKYQVLKKPRIVVGPGLFASYVTKALFRGELYRDNSTTPYLGFMVNESGYTKLDAGVAGIVMMAVPLSKRLDLEIGVADNLGLINTRTEPALSPTRTNNLCLQIGIAF